MTGYFSNEEATASTLDSQGWLRTGDLCYIDEDGFIFVVDRLKELIKYKGYQVNRYVFFFGRILLIMLKISENKAKQDNLDNWFLKVEILKTRTSLNFDKRNLNNRFSSYQSQAAIRVLLGFNVETNL